MYLFMFNISLHPRRVKIYLNGAKMCSVNNSLTFESCFFKISYFDSDSFYNYKFDM